MPDLHFHLEGAAAVRHAAVPTIGLSLAIENRTSEPINSIMLTTQVRIAATRRHYTSREQEWLVELFGNAGRWGDTLRGLLWTHAITVVPPFTNRTVTDLAIPCTYDFDVVSAKYFSGLEQGEIPLELLFSGTVFYRGPDGALRTGQIPWEKEASYRLPLAVWKQVMESYFPGTAWLRVHRETFDRLYRFKAQHGFATWEAALEDLLGESREIRS